MYDIRALGRVLLVGAPVLAAVFLINTMLVLVSATYPNWLPRQFFGVDFLADNRQRVVAASNHYANEPAAEPLVVVLGLSSASEGIVLSELSGLTGDDLGNTKVLGLSGGGRNISDIRRYAGPLLESAMDPELVVFAINPFHLMDPPPPSKAFRDNVHKAMAAGEFRGRWLVNRRKDIKYAVDARADQVRTSLFSRFSVRIDDGANPWRDFLKMGLRQAKNEVEWRRNIVRYGERGYYDAENYKRSASQVQLFLELVRGFNEKGSRVVVVLMPEHSLLRSRIPAAATNVVYGSLADALGEEAPVVISLREAIPDSGFKDISHMNARGREKFSPEISKVIADHLPPD